MELLEQEEVAPPKLRFKASGAYRRFLLGELCSFSLGRNIKQGEASPEFDTPCVRYGELYHMYGEVIDEVVNRTNLDRSELLFSQGDEILLPSAGEDPMDIGNASALTLKGIAIGRTINILRPLRPDAYCHKYVAYYIREKLRETIAALAQGVSISNVYNTQLRTLEVKLPTLPEQQKIAAFLGAVDRKIQQLKRKQELLERYKKRVAQQLFSQELRFKREDGSAYPEWEEKTLGEMGETRGGLTYTPEDVVEEGGTLVLRSSNIQDGRIAFDDCVYVSCSVPPKSIVRDGDILICVRNGSRSLIGKSMLITTEHEGVAFGAFMSVYRSECSAFVAQLMTTPLFYKQVHEHLGATINQITNASMNSFRFNFPCLEEQTRIAGFLMALDAKVARVAQAVAAAQKWKKGLLQQMFV